MKHNLTNEDLARIFGPYIWSDILVNEGKKFQSVQKLQDVSINDKQAVLHFQTTFGGLAKHRLAEC